jgi:signal transduction histidine kinase
VVLLGALGLLFVLIRASLKPLQPIHGAVKAIGQGQFEPGLEPQGSAEFRELASGINAMARQIQQMLQAKQELLLAISHELRSPLTRARIHLELLAPGEERDAVISDMREMQQLVATLLESERLNQRHAVLHLERFDAAQSIERLLQTEFVAQRIDSDLSALTVEADPVRFELLIRNLLDNALKYSQSAPQPPQVRLRQDGESLLVEVEDFGIGMGAEQLARATEAFFRADHARQRSTGGFGLGLYLCQQIVAVHGGQMTLNSEPQKGTCVTLKLPLTQSHEAGVNS